MTNTFQLDMITPQQTVYSGEVVSLMVPAEHGYMGLMANHAPIITHIRKGMVKIQIASGDVARFAVQGDGFLEMEQNRAKLLVDAVEKLPE